MHSCNCSEDSATSQCQLDDFENDELPLLVFVEGEQVHVGTERLQEHDCTARPRPAVHCLVGHLLKTEGDTWLRP